MEPLTKLLFIGIDAMDKDLIHQWVKEGHLPTFKHLMENTAWGPTHNPPGLFAGALWPSFFTGVSPAQHSRYWFRQLQSGTYDMFTFRASQVKEEPFWNHLSRANKKVAVIDVPKTFPSENLNGIHIVNWGLHDPEGKITTWPPSLTAEVVEKFGENSLFDCNTIERDATGFAQLRDDLIRRLQKKTDLSLHFLKKGGWDCFVTVFSESHCAGHQCWHLHDPTHPLYDPAIARVTGDIMKEVYIALDAAVGKLLEQVGKDTHTIVLASHGMGPQYEASFLLDEMLEKLEKIPGENQPFIDSILQGVVDPKSSKKYPRMVNALKWVRDKLPRGVGIRRMLKKYTKAKMHERKLQALERLKKRKCFPIPNSNAFGGIRINLVGREPNGVIHPGTEYDDFCQSLTQDLFSFTNVENGEPLITKVLRTDEIYQGDHMDGLPDLMVEWSRAAPISTIHSPKTGEISGESDCPRTGDHKPEGLFFASGNSIKPGRIERPVSVMDFAPTIASLLEVELSEVEGQSIFIQNGGS